MFATPRSGDARTVRYFRPVAEVAFCGHATMALGVALGTGDSDEARYRLTTRSADVGLHVAAAASGPVAAVTLIEPSHVARPPAVLVPAALELLGWRDDELDDQLRQRRLGCVVAAPRK